MTYPKSMPLEERRAREQDRWHRRKLRQHTENPEIPTAPRLPTIPPGQMIPPPDPTPFERVEIMRARERARAADSALKDTLTALAETRDQVRALTYLASEPLPPIKRCEFGSGIREATAVALLSDLHVETLVRPGATPVGNIFTLGIAEHRLQRFFEGVLWQVGFKRGAFQIRNLVLWLGGDLITNHLHPENIETAQLGPGPALLWVQTRILSGIRMLLELGEFERIDLVCSFGNHGRTTEKMRSATGADHSWEWLSYQTIALLFKDEPRIRVLADRAAHQYHQIYDYNVHFHHGHEISYQGGVGGIMIPVNKATAAWDRAKRCELHNYGHWHQYLDVGQVTGNGSLIGFDSYAMRVKAAPEPPQQAMYLVDSKRCKCESTPIWVGDPAREREIWNSVAHIYGDGTGK